MDCPVCFEAARELNSGTGTIETECRRCGRFKFTGAAWDKLRNAPAEKRALVCGWLWEQSRVGSVPTIDETNVDALLGAGSIASGPRCTRRRRNTP
jgi:hypothetical protein